MEPVLGGLVFGTLFLIILGIAIYTLKNTRIGSWVRKQMEV